MQDLLTAWLNAAFLFLIVFFAYPLKFLATFLWRLVRGVPTSEMFVLPEGVEWSLTEYAQREGMMYVYGLGMMGVFGLLALMLLRAYHEREQLELDELERHLTRVSIVHHMLTVGISALSVTILALGSMPGVAGIVHFLMGPLHGIMGFWGGRRAARIRLRLVDAP